MQLIWKLRAFINQFLAHLTHLSALLVNAEGILLTSTVRNGTLFNTPASEYPESYQSHFTHNKNINLAVAEPPLTEMNVHTVFSMMELLEWIALRAISEISDRMKWIFFNEKPNYYTRFGQTKPYCPAGKRGAGTALYRI